MQKAEFRASVIRVRLVGDVHQVEVVDLEDVQRSDPDIYKAVRSGGCRVGVTIPDGEPYCVNSSCGQSCHLKKKDEGGGTIKYWCECY